MTYPSEMHIAGRPIGRRHSPYVIAALAAKPGEDLERALRIVRLAGDSGADAVALQAPPEWLPRLAAEARGLGIAPLAVPGHAGEVAQLAALDLPAYRIAPASLTDLDLIRRCAATGRPLILSTGAAGIRQLADAVAAARTGGGTIVLKEADPARVEQANLATIADMVTRFGVAAGFCDRTAGADMAAAAVALGAVAVEKHGADSPEALRALVAGCRTAFAARGQACYGAAEAAERQRMNVAIAPLGVEDVSEEYVAWLNDPEVVRYTEVRPGANDRAGVEHYVRQMAASAKDRTFAIRADGMHVGNIKLSSISREHGTARVALLIGRRDLWGCGIATRAIEAICREGFETLGLRKLIAGVYAGNHGSIRAFERAGFAIEAVLRANRVFEGQPVDEFLLAKFRQDTP